jgi:hypothetical protein
VIWCRTPIEILGASRQALPSAPRVPPVERSPAFDQALVDVGIASDAQVLHDYFAWTTLNTMARYQRSAEDVPDGLQIPQWSWDGLVDGRWRPKAATRPLVVPSPYGSAVVLKDTNQRR